MRIFLLCTVTDREIKATPARINSIIIHAADRDTGPQKDVFRAVESWQGCQVLVGLGPWASSQGRKRWALKDTVLWSVASS